MICAHQNTKEDIRWPSLLISVLFEEGSLLDPGNQILSSTLQVSHACNSPVSTPFSASTTGVYGTMPGLSYEFRI